MMGAPVKSGSKLFPFRLESNKPIHCYRVSSSILGSDVASAIVTIEIESTSIRAGIA
jgi:hypothetical protein